MLKDFFQDLFCFFALERLEASTQNVVHDHSSAPNVAWLNRFVNLCYLLGKFFSFKQLRGYVIICLIIFFFNPKQVGVYQLECIITDDDNIICLYLAMDFSSCMHGIDSIKELTNQCKGLLLSL